MVKVCARCLEEKEESDYTIRKQKTRTYLMAYCKPCYASWARERRVLNPSSHRTARKKHYLANKQRILQKKREVYSASPEGHLQRTRLWKEANKPHINWYQAGYRSRKKQAMPKWANKFFIEEIYQLAFLRSRILSIEFEVDHIVPLNSPIVCGLHNEFNLRIITARDNQVKGNRYWPDMP